MLRGLRSALHEVMSPGTLLLFGTAALHLSWLAFRWGREADLPLLANLLFLAPSLVAALVVVAVGFAGRGRARWGWLLVGSGLAAQVVGNGIWSYLDLVAKSEPFPSAADFFYLLLGPLLAAGLLYLLPPSRTRSESLRLGLDLTITVGTAGLFFWRFMLAPPLTSGEPALSMLVTVAYPFLDLLLLSLLALLLLRKEEGERLSAPFVLFGLGMVAQVLGNTFYNAALANEGYQIGHPIDAFWTVSTVLLTLAARSHRERPRHSVEDRAVEDGAAKHRAAEYRALTIFVPYLALAAGFGLLLATEANPAVRDTLEGRGVLYGAVLVTFAVVLRQLLAFYENRRLTEHLLEHGEELRVLSETLDLKVRERTAELEGLSECFRHDALHDALTGLPNRTHFKQRVQAAAAQGRSYSVLYLDFDRFKSVNDNFGHGVGDALLVAIAARLESFVRPGGLVAHLGGDEFAVLLGNVDNARDAVGVAERLTKAFESPLKVGAHTLTCTASIGAVLDHGTPERVDDVLRDADIAMYRAKALGRARYVVFEPTMREIIQSRLTLEAELRGAASRGELEAYYQPVLRAQDGTVAGFEALVRWRHPQRGLLAPAEFISLAEESGLITEIDRWALRRACLQLVVWDALDSCLSVSVNLSGSEFAQADLAPFVAEVLSETGLAPHRLKLELTESLLMNTSSAVQHTLTALRELGVRLHIDDFGTGYSSLSYLQRLDADVLKVDRSFIMQMLENEAGAELVRTIVSMAHNLEMKVVAEGVETDAQFVFLRTLGCEYVQGYLFAPPLPEAAVALFLEHCGVGTAAKWPGRSGRGQGGGADTSNPACAEGRGEGASSVTKQFRVEG